MATSASKPLILVDGSSYLYRAFHAMPTLTTSKGLATGAVYGVVNMLKKLISDYDPEHIAVIFDAKGKTFRHNLFAAYKANRPSMPPELASQIEPIHSVIRALGVPIISIEGVEADDIIGTLSQWASNQKLPVLISTGDKDLAQLVNSHVTLVNTMTNTLLTPESVKDKFGVPPERIVDLLALVGDTVDNIPGVPKVGPKTAVKWLLEYGSLENVIQEAPNIGGKVGENLRNALSQLPLTKLLATIKLDVEIGMTLADLKRKSADKNELKRIYQELEFKTWLAELLKENFSSSSLDKYADYQTILTDAQLEEWLGQLTKAQFFAFDTETTSLNYMQAEIVGLSFAIQPGKAMYIPLNHNYEDAPQQLNRESVLTKLKPILEDASLKKVGHNIKYDLEVLANHGIQLQGIAFDTMLESYVLDSSSNTHDMDTLAIKQLGWRTITYEEVAGKGVKQKTFNLVPLDKAATYAAEDADVTLRLHQTLHPRLQENASLSHILSEIEIPLIPVLARIERNGVLIDPDKLRTQNLELEKKLIELEQQAYELAGNAFNLNSPKQLQEILFNTLQLPVLQKTPTGQPSTADAVLQELALDYALPQLIIEYRSLSKLITTYTRKLPEQINPNTKRIHTSYNQTGAATGRLSSSDPNLQNIPVRTLEGRRIRQAFIAPPGYKIISADYSQIELRIMAHLSNDSSLLHAFEHDLDIHQATAAEILGLPLNEVTAEQRRSAKAINFGIIYGMSAFGLAKQLGVERQAAQAYIDQYFTRYPLIKAYMENTRAKAHANGYVETLWGRRLYLPDINSSQIFRQKAAERTAINAPLQGTAADIIKCAMISVDKWLMKSHIPARMIMQVHDELVFEVQEDIAENTAEQIRQHMMQAASLKVPLLVAVGTGDNWDAASSH